MPLPYKLGDHGPEIEYFDAWFNTNYPLYAPPNDGYYGDDEYNAVVEMQRRLGLPQTGVFDSQTAHLAGYTPPPGDLPLFFTVEGHSSDMFAGPVADTATQLESEGLCHHMPTGYNNGAIPFDNQSGVNELARRVGQTVQDNGVPFPAGTKWALGTFSQGSIVGYDFWEQHMMPGCDLAWRAPDCVGILAYGDPCRSTNSCAPWSVAQGSNNDGTFGLDPYKRYGLPGCVPVLPNFMDVWRQGDIFSQNTNDLKGQLKASIYQAVARGDVFSNPYSLAAELVSQLPAVAQENVPELIMFGVGIIQAIISGVVFLADQPSPHYSPYNLDGGLAWMRGLLT